jgi:hypothetical protein
MIVNLSACPASTSATSKEQLVTSLTPYLHLSYLAGSANVRIAPKAVIPARSVFGHDRDMPSGSANVRL